MKPVRIFATLGLLGGLVTALPADAATYIVPGIACRPQNPANDQFMNWWFHGGVENVNSASSVATVCPLTRHNSSSNLTGTAYVRVRNSTASVLNCSLSAYPANSESGGDFENASTTTTGYSSLLYNTANLTLFTFGKYIVNCFLETGDRIDSVRYEEP